MFNQIRLILLWMLMCLSGVSLATPKQAVQFTNPWLVCPSDAYTPDVDVSSLSCHETELPQAWEAVMPNYDGFAVYHNQFKLLKKNQRLDFYVEQIRDADKVFVNGHLIGEMGGVPTRI